MTAERRSVTVAVDANGADKGPVEVLLGARQAVEADPALRVVVFGPAQELARPTGGEPRIEIVDAPVSIAKEPDPARAVRATPDASIVRAAKALAAGEADALVSGGSTGAALASGLFHVKRARGIHRPALAILVPVPGTPFLLLDAGANVDVRPEHLVQFAHMGAAFMSAVARRASARAWPCCPTAPSPARGRRTSSRRTRRCAARRWSSSATSRASRSPPARRT